MQHFLSEIDYTRNTSGYWLYINQLRVSYNGSLLINDYV